MKLVEFWTEEGVWAAGDCLRPLLTDILEEDRAKLPSLQLCLRPWWQFRTIRTGVVGCPSKLPLYDQVWLLSITATFLHPTPTGENRKKKTAGGDMKWSFKSTVRGDKIMLSSAEAVTEQPSSSSLYSAICLNSIHFSCICSKFPFTNH